MSHRPLLGVLLALLAGVAGCAATGGRALPHFGSWETRKALLQATDEWEFSGRIGVIAGDDGFNGKLWWRQDGPVFRARISGPVGVGTMFINGHGGEVSLTDTKGETIELDDVEIDLEERYGWTLPVESLRYWALGVPDPAAPGDVRLNDAGQLSEIEQRAWQVVIDQYREGGGQPMPRRLTAWSGDTRVRLLIDEWRFR